MEALFIGCLGALVVVCFVGAIWAYRRGIRLERELEAQRLDERFDSLYRVFDERYENLKRDNVVAHEALQREVQANIESLSRFNDTDHNDILSRLDDFDDQLDSKKSKR